MAGRIQDMAANWLASMKSDQTKKKYVEGINSTTVDPTERAAARVDAWVSGVANAKDRFTGGLRRAGKSRWQKNSLGKGANNLSTGASLNYDKMQAYAQYAAPVLQAASDAAKQEKMSGVSGRERMNNNYDRMVALRRT